MQENNVMMRNFIQQLYALPLRSVDSEHLLLIEGEDGIVHENAGNQFQYRIERKIAGIAQLKQQLQTLRLKLMFAYTKRDDKVFPKVFVAENIQQDFSAELTSEQMTRFNILIATEIMGRHAAKAYVTGNSVDEAILVDNREREERLRLAQGLTTEELAKINKEKAIKTAQKEYIQAQLDEVFHSPIEMNNTHKVNLDAAIQNSKDQKTLTAEQEKALFSCIQHTYGSVEVYLDGPAEPENVYLKPIHNILQDLNKEKLKELYYKPGLSLDTVEEGKQGIIDTFKAGKTLAENQKLALSRTVTKAGIVVSQLNNQEYTDALQGKAKTLYDKLKDVADLQTHLQSFQKLDAVITRDEAKIYGKLLLQKETLQTIINSENEDILKGAFKILDGQAQGYDDRLRTALNDPAEVISRLKMNLLLKKGHEIAQKVTGIVVDDLEVASYPAQGEVSFNSLAYGSTTPESLLNERQYNLKFLEEGHVIGMAKHLAEKIGTELNNPYVVNSGAMAKTEMQKQTQEKYIQAAVLKTFQGTTSQLFISTGNHWTTCGLLPLKNAEGKVVKIAVINMDSMSANINSDIGQKITFLAGKLGLQAEYYNMSVKGQQQGACCGFASGCNGFSLQKTYNDLIERDGKLPVKEDGSFDQEAFKKALLPNVVYRHDTIEVGGESSTGTVLYGNKPSNVTLERFVKDFGGLALQAIVSKDAMKSHLGDNKIKFYMEKTKHEFAADKTKIDALVKNKVPLTDEAIDNSTEQVIRYNSKCYSLTKEEITDITDVKYYKGLDGIIKGKALSTLLSNKRTKQSFAKLLKDEFASGKHPYTKKFVEDRELLKNIVHIDQELEGQIKEVINAAIDQEAANPIEISVLDALLIWLYKLPVLGKIVEFFGSEVVKVAATIDTFENKCESWQGFKAITEPVNTLIAA